MLYVTGVVSVEARLPGDYNQDGSVDAADYVVWRKAEGQSRIARESAYRMSG